MRSIPQTPKKRTSKSGTPVYSSGGHVIGHVDGGTFYKVVTGSKHFLKQPPAIMNDLDALKDAELLGATLAKVTDRESGNVYTAPIALIWEKPIYKNYGYGEQVGLALREWTKNGVPPVTIKAAPQVEKPQQFKLW